MEEGLEDFYNSSESKMTKERYFMMCEQLEKIPIPDEIPLGFEDFPKEVQDAIMIYSILPDIWEGFGGTFLGKDYSILPYLANQVYMVEDHVQLMQFLLMINNIVSKNRAQKQKQERAKAKRKGK